MRTESIGSSAVIYGMTFRERINQGSSRPHARNSFPALTAVCCAATDAFRKIHNDNFRECSLYESPLAWANSTEQML